VDLGGNIRPIINLEKRLMEAKSLGLKFYYSEIFQNRNIKKRRNKNKLYKHFTTGIIFGKIELGIINCYYPKELS